MSWPLGRHPVGQYFEDFLLVVDGTVLSSTGDRGNVMQGWNAQARGVYPNF